MEETKWYKVENRYNWTIEERGNKMNKNINLSIEEKAKKFDEAISSKSCLSITKY
jgi:hypothetical protein